MEFGSLDGGEDGDEEHSGVSSGETFTIVTWYIFLWNWPIWQSVSPNANTSEIRVHNTKDNKNFILPGWSSETWQKKVNSYTIFV